MASELNGRSHKNHTLAAKDRSSVAVSVGG